MSAPVLLITGASRGIGAATARIAASRGYTVFPVNPTLAGKQVLGREVYATVADVPEPIDMVDVFRRSELCVPHAVEAVDTGARCLWLQLGVVNWEAARIANAAGLAVVMDRCTAIEVGRIGPRG